MLRSSTVSKTQEDGCRTAAHQQGAGARLPSSAPSTAQPLLDLQTPLPAPSSPSSSSPLLKVLFRRMKLFVIVGLLQAAQVTGGSEKQVLLAVDQEELRGL